jgi:protein TonB
MPQRQRENSPVPSRPPEVPPEHSAARQNSETPQEKGALEDQSALSGGTSQESPSSPGENAVGSYLAQIRGLIDSRKEYPYQARQQEQEGTVGIRFTLSRQGLLVGEPVVEKRSRYQHLNAAALRAVQNAAPYPPFPGEIGDEAMSFQVELSFFLK